MERGTIERHRLEVRNDDDDEDDDDDDDDDDDEKKKNVGSVAQ